MVGDGGIVVRCMAEGLAHEVEAGIESQRASVCRQLGGQCA